MTVRVRVEGGAQLARSLAGVSDRVSVGLMRRALETVAAPPIQARAAQMAPRAAGAPDLAQHIVISAARGSARTASVAVGPSTESRTDQPSRAYDLQGLYVEYGTNDTPMQPFLRPAFLIESAKAIRAFGAEMWRSIAARGLGSGRGSSSGGGLL